MPIEARAMAQMTQVDKIICAVVGPYKSGKSWLVATARPPVLFLDVDQRWPSLVGKKDVFNITPTNPAGLNMQPTVYSDVLKLVGNLERSRKLKEISNTFVGPDGEREVRSVCLDSIQSMSRECLGYAMYTNPKELAREISIGSQKVQFAKNFDTWNADMAMLDQLVSRMVGIPGVDFYITFHEDDDNGKIVPFPGRHKHILRMFSDVWRIQRTNNTGIPSLQLLPSPNFTASTTLVGCPGVVENPNIVDLIAKYGKR
jgi:hypothetical protein